MGTDHDGLERLAEDFLRIGREKRTGTLKVEGPGGSSCYLLFIDGAITDLDPHQELSFLASVVMRTGRVSDRELKRCRKAEARSGRPLGAVLLEAAGEVPEELLVAATQSTLADLVCSLFAEPLEAVTFIEHQADERLEDFQSELQDFLEVRADPEEIFLEACRRLNRWDMAEENFAMVRDVYYATPAAFRYFQEEGAYPDEVAVIGLVDGRRNFLEVIEKAAEAAGLDPFQALTVIRNLILHGEIEPLNPVQLFQLGVEHQANGDHHKAIHLFRRAHERGLDDFDLSFKIALALEAVGARDEAAERYQEYGEKCLQHKRPADALRSYRKAADLEPRNLDWQLKLLDLFLLEDLRPEALAQGLMVASRLSEEGNPRRGLQILQDLRERGFKDEVLAQKILQLAGRSGDAAVIRAEREKQAGDFSARKDVEKALAMCQQLFCQGNATPEVRLKLVELHYQKGNHKLVLEHVGSLLNLSENERIKDPLVLKRLHEIVCELRPGDLRSHRWMVDYHVRNGSGEKAVSHLKGLVAHLEREGDQRDAARVLRQLVIIDEASLEHRWRLVEALEKLEKTPELLRELRDLSQAALQRSETRDAERALLALLKGAPFDVEARQTLGDLYSAQGDSARAAHCFREAALLHDVQGDAAASERCWKRLQALEPRNAAVAVRLGDLAQAAGEEARAVEENLRAARLHLEAHNLGLARELTMKALKIRPSHAEGKEVLRSLEALENPPQKAPAQKAPARPAKEPAKPAARAAAPAAAAPEAPSGREAGPFHPSTPVVQKSVAGITARLKSMKAGGAQRPPQAAQAQAAEPAAGAAGGATPPPAGPQPAAAAASPGGQPIKSAGLGGAASKLRALAAAGAARPPSPPPPAEAGAAAPATPAATAPAPADAPAPAEPHGVAATPVPPAATPPESKPGGAPAAEAPREATPPLPDPGDLERLRAALQKSASGTPAASSGASTAGGTRSLGKSAALLSKLRKGAPAAGERGPDRVNEVDEKNPG